MIKEIFNQQFCQKKSAHFDLQCTSDAECLVKKAFCRNGHKMTGSTFRHLHNIHHESSCFHMAERVWDHSNLASLMHQRQKHSVAQYSGRIYLTKYIVHISPIFGGMHSYPHPLKQHFLPFLQLLSSLHIILHVPVPLESGHRAFTEGKEKVVWFLNFK